MPWLEVATDFYKASFPLSVSLYLPLASIMYPSRVIYDNTKYGLGVFSATIYVTVFINLVLR